MDQDSSSNVIVRSATPDDAGNIIALISALADFEHLEGPDENAVERFIEHGFGQHPKFEAWIAELPEESNKAVGYAILYSTFSTFLVKPGLYLEDLFVLPAYRRLGIGKKLLRHCMELAVERGCGRLEWTCLDWNVNAQSVYEGIGAKKMAEWLLYRMTEEALGGYLGKAV